MWIDSRAATRQMEGDESTRLIHFRHFVVMRLAFYNRSRKTEFFFKFKSKFAYFLVHSWKVKCIIVRLSFLQPNCMISKDTLDRKLSKSSKKIVKINETTKMCFRWLSSHMHLRWEWFNEHASVLGSYNLKVKVRWRWVNTKSSDKAGMIQRSSPNV